MKFQLYKLSRDFRALDELLDEEGGDITNQEDAFAELEQSLSEAQAETIDDMVAYVKNIEPFAEAAKAEAKRLTAAAKKIEELCGKVKGQIKHHLIKVGEKKLRTERFEVSVVANGGALPLEINVKPEQLPPYLQTSVIVIEADKQAIRDACEMSEGGVLMSGDGVVIASLKERGTRLQIK